MNSTLNYSCIRSYEQHLYFTRMYAAEIKVNVFQYEFYFLSACPPLG